MPRPVGLIILLIAALVCGFGFTASDSAEDRFVAAAPQGQPAGTALADGFTVPDGTLLLGDVFDTVSESSTGPDGVFAVLLVRGDGLAATADLVAQATKQGIEVKAADLACGTGLAVVASAPLSSTSTGDYTCALVGRKMIDASNYLELHLSTYVSAGSDPYVAYITFELVSYALNGVVLSDYGKTAAVPGFPSPIRPGPVAQVPSAGSRLGLPFVARGEHYQVVSGTRLLAPVAPRCLSDGGFVAVFKVDGSPDEAFAAYTRQLAGQNYLHSVGDFTTASGGRTQRTTTVGAPNAGTAHVAYTTEPDGTTYLLVERCTIIERD